MRHDWLCSQRFPEEQKQEQRLPGAHWNDQVFQGAFFFALSFAVVTLRPHRVVRVTFLVPCSPLQTPLTESLIEFTDPAMNRVAADLFLCKFSPSVVFSYINNFLIFLQPGLQVILCSEMFSYPVPSTAYLFIYYIYIYIFIYHILYIHIRQSKSWGSCFFPVKRIWGEFFIMWFDHLKFRFKCWCACVCVSWLCILCSHHAFHGRLSIKGANRTGSGQHFPQGKHTDHFLPCLLCCFLFDSWLIFLCCSMYFCVYVHASIHRSAHKRVLLDEGWGLLPAPQTAYH